MQSHRPLSPKYEVEGLQDLVKALTISRATNNRALLTIRGSLISFWGRRALAKMLLSAIKTAKWDDFVLIVDAERNNATGHLAIHTPFVSKVILSNPPEPIEKLALKHNISIIKSS